MDFFSKQRILGATIDGVRILDLYVVNGQEVGSEKFAHKLFWLEKVAEHIREELKQHQRLIVLGDFNITPDDRDVYDPEAWRERILCSTPERNALQKILDLGMVDTFRLFEQDENSYSWWDYRAAAFRRNMGLRIDLILASIKIPLESPGRAGLGPGLRRNLQRHSPKSERSHRPAS